MTISGLVVPFARAGRCTRHPGRPVNTVSNIRATLVLRVLNKPDTLPVCQRVSQWDALFDTFPKEQKAMTANRVELGAAIQTAIAAHGYQARLWTSAAEHLPQVRVYVARRLSRGMQDMGYVEVLDDASRSYGELTRAKASIRDAVEAALTEKKP